MATERIFPTAQDIGDADGRGAVASEGNLARTLELASQLSDGVFTGFAVSTVTGLTVRASAGELLVSGYRVVEAAELQVAVTDDATRGVWYQLTRDGNDEVVSGTLIESASVLPGAIEDAVLLAVVTTASGAVTRTDDERRWLGGLVAGTYTGDGTSSRTIAMSRTPRFVIVTGEDEDDSRIWAASALHPEGHHRLGAAAEALPGFYFYSPNPMNLWLGTSGSKTYDPPNLTAGTDDTTTVAVTGARRGNLVACEFDGTVSVGSYTMAGVVTDDDSVDVTLTKTGGTDNIGSGTLTVHCYGPAQYAQAQLGGFIDLATTGVRTPVIVSGGFKIGDDGGSPAAVLNADTREYRYLAFM